MFDYLDVMANHEPFTDHMLKQWQYSGPDRGVGSKARVEVSAAGRTETVDIEVVSAQRPETIVERNVSAGGHRVGHGTYKLEDLPGRRHADHVRIFVAAGAAQRPTRGAARARDPAPRKYPLDAATGASSSPPR